MAGGLSPLRRISSSPSRPGAWAGAKQGPSNAGAWLGDPSGQAAAGVGGELARARLVSVDQQLSGLRGVWGRVVDPELLDASSASSSEAALREAFREAERRRRRRYERAVGTSLYWRWRWFAGVDCAPCLGLMAAGLCLGGFGALGLFVAITSPDFNIDVEKATGHPFW